MIRAGLQWGGEGALEAAGSAEEEKPAGVRGYLYTHQQLGM
jgi:hypothetical protein